ncbi:hypothetical protein E2986_07357 [Frieseomelitta varia]|uniref:Cilia-and flagella-associated protein 96 n=1 Tax=Frieseomelitta varia TaxID=561572 RepID=A0A833RJ08_9HYME|nr:UPF0602 protein C4orf47 homolog [Frieseomelitta varia]KAF3429604.1 hypothetical protein E2986_07357 [Frieseomelitta varia]
MERMGKQFGKTDLDRIGYFHDPSPAPFDRYRGTPVKSRDAVERERQMLAGPSGDLFEEKFARIFYGEALHEPWRFEAKERLEREKAKIGGVLLPPSPAKKHSTPGDYYGCFEKVTYFEPAALKERRRGTRTPELPNVKIKPNPRGGPGYADICLSPFPSHNHDPYDPPRKHAAPAARFLNASTSLDYFPPNPYVDKDLAPTYKRPIDRAPRMIGPAAFYVPFPKKPGGNHSGCFDKFPLYSGDPYDERTRKKMEKKPIGVFVSGGPPRRAKYTTSVIDQVTRVSCNATNYIDYKPQVYPLNEQRM